MTLRTYPLIVLSALLAITSGCGSDEPPRTQLSGRVLIDGEPLSLGVVKFAPKGGRQSMGAIQDDGTFTLGSFSADDGVLVGECRVAVVAREELSPTSARWHAPKKYSNYSTSGVVVTVDESEPEVTIDLSWDGRKGPYVENM